MNTIETGPSNNARDSEVWSRSWTHFRVDRRSPRYCHVAGFVGCVAMPWPRSTISYHLDGGTLVTSTMNTYQHPESIALGLAILLPVLRELYRWKKRTDAQRM